MASRASLTLVLAALLLGLALPRAAPGPLACAEPAERRARGGHSVEVGCAGGAPLRGPARRLFGLALDPNRADARTLETLPGIGPARARAIAAERRRRPFARVADLLRVAGIGPRTLESIAGHLAIEPARGEAAGASVDSPRGEAPR